MDLDLNASTGESNENAENNNVSEVNEVNKLSDLIFMKSEYEGIENMVNPDTFYSLLGKPKTDVFQKDRTVFLVSRMHYNFAELIRQHLIKVKRVNINRALISLGLISKVQKRHMLNSAVQHYISLYKNSRLVDNQRRFEESLHRLEVSPISKDYVINEILPEYGQNKYGQQLLTRITESWELLPPIDYHPNRFIIPSHLFNMCASILKHPLSDAMYHLKKQKITMEDNTSMRVDVYVSKRISIISRAYGGIHCPEIPPNQLLRGHFVAGIYILAYWIVNEKLNSVEYCLHKMINLIDKFVANNS